MCEFCAKSPRRVCLNCQVRRKRRFIRSPCCTWHTAMISVTLIVLFICNLFNLSSSEALPVNKSKSPDKGSRENVNFVQNPSKSSSTSAAFFASSSSSESFVRKTLSPRTVKIKYGSLRGSLIALGSFKSNSLVKLKGYVEVFQGVPYALPPTASLRFMPPVTPAYWKGTKLCTKFASVCPQILPSFPASPAGDDDALCQRIINSVKRKYKSPVHSSSPRTPPSPSPRSSPPPPPPPPSHYSAHQSHLVSWCHRRLHVQKIMSYLKDESEDCLYLNLYAPYPSTALNGSSEYLFSLFTCLDLILLDRILCFIRLHRLVTCMYFLINRILFAFPLHWLTVSFFSLSFSLLLWPIDAVPLVLVLVRAFPRLNESC